MVSKIEIDESTHVLELGVGSGALTRALLAEGLRPEQYTGIEVRPDLVAALRARFPSLTFIQDSALNLPRILSRSQVVPSHVVASLPWSTMRSRDRRSCLSTIAGALRSGGRLLTYSYVSALLFLPAGRRATDDFVAVFPDVAGSGVVWRNVPPAMVWTCSR